jgi:hypothetical protein
VTKSFFFSWDFRIIFYTLPTDDLLFFFFKTALDIILQLPALTILLCKPVQDGVDVSNCKIFAIVNLISNGLMMSKCRLYGSMAIR